MQQGLLAASLGGAALMNLLEETSRLLNSHSTAIEDSGSRLLVLKSRGDFKG